ncbi:hypothetical protein Tsubulata_001222 [Turnera subulata]|uniref:Cupin type-1 domain-containing protein n=1 Tax=Turnera subulata TaxID=218843 RepID=A0A9Q0J145_9ROSI|nr:hypothetical protein Tsubulata_001222 [Turnera subulata]
MASPTMLCVTLGLLVLVQSCFAQLEQMPRQQFRPERQREMRSQQNECQLERITAQEPSRRFESEAGFTEIFNENDEQFRCAGVAVLRHTIQQRGLLLPSYSNTPKLVYVEQGRGFHGAAFPGCPETFQSSRSQAAGEQHRGFSRDEHQKVRQIREGDVVALPAGVADWFYNEGNTPLVLVQFLDTGNAANQLDQDFRKFFLAGNPQREFQSQRGQFEREGGRSLRRQTPGGPQQTYRNVFSGFDEQFLAEAFNIDTQLASRLRNEDDRRGIIVRAEHELRFVGPQFSREESEALEREESERERGSRGGRFMNGFEETFCSARLRHNMNDPSGADLFNPRAGRLKTVNSFDLPILRFLQFSAKKVFLYRYNTEFFGFLTCNQNAMMTPNWNKNAHSICYVTRGSGRVQIVSDNGQTVFDQEVRQGQVFTVPQNFAVVKRAGDEGFEYFSFKTNDHAEINQLAGRVSVFRAIPEEVLSNAFQISREEARRLKFNREEVTLFSPSQFGRV